MTRILIALAVFSAGLGVGWSALGWRLGEQIAEIRLEHSKAELSNAMAAGVQEAEWTKYMEDARNEATTREQAIRRDAHNAADGLQRELADIQRSIPTLAADACRQRADTLANILGQCSAEYQSLAERADRHVSDVKTLKGSWPR